MAGPHPLASHRSWPACLGDALQLGDEGLALCVFQSGERWGESADVGRCCLAKATSRPGWTPAPQTRRGRLWGGAFDPFPGLGAPWWEASQERKALGAQGP